MSEGSYLDRRLGLAGKVAVVVGGGGGLGRAIALDLGRAGMRLELADRNEDLLDATRRQLDDEGIETRTTPLDARDPDELARFFGGVAGRHHRIHTLVNVVGGTFRQQFADSNPRGWDTLIRTNFTWLLHSTHLALPLLDGGSIINLTSIEAHRAAPGHAVYTAMKAAVQSLTQTLAVEFAPRGIRVNAIAADRTPSEGILAALPSDRTGTGWGDDPASILANQVTIPMGRVGRDGDVGGCAVFLASDLSSYVTGTALHPDGGALAASGWMNWPETGFANSLPAGVVRRLFDAEGPS